MMRPRHVGMMISPKKGRCMTTRLPAAQRRAIFKEILARARQLGAAGVPTREIYADVVLLRDDLMDAFRQGLTIQLTGATSAPEEEDPDATERTI